MTAVRSSFAILKAAVAILLCSGVATAQTVQLPSIESFSYSGSVVVPDRGTAFLGGNRSASFGSRRSGLQRGFGSSQSISQATVSATIIDLKEMDRQILGGTPEQFLQRERQREKSGAAPPRNLDPDFQGKALVRYARTQYRQGNTTAAFAGYQQAIAVLSPHLKNLATAEFKRVFGSAAEQALHMASLR
ncbi:hypothetical protein RMSM_03210 [Rhodopirellula maiorica SM1]|uniref:Secreted protein n=1 Tax=Rhodopirellula maiorica SM1 TaxID=1265738 RepID=M5RKM1_9BACT|nr:hypothetical protein [Rhodopirellula maiorica]EMI19868.1 hypothetical protein RMSM_03210 [Rhodopirellula maiorica SM1]